MQLLTGCFLTQALSETACGSYHRWISFVQHSQIQVMRDFKTDIKWFCKTIYVYINTFLAHFNTDSLKFHIFCSIKHKILILLKCRVSSQTFNSLFFFPKYRLFIQGPAVGYGVPPRESWDIKYFHFLALMVEGDEKFEWLVVSQSSHLSINWHSGWLGDETNKAAKFTI